MLKLSQRYFEKEPTNFTIHRTILKIAIQKLNTLTDKTASICH